MRYLTTGEGRPPVARLSVGTLKNWIEAGQLEAFRTRADTSGSVRANPAVPGRVRLRCRSDESPGPRVDDQQDFIDLAVDGLKDLVPGAKVEGACGGYEALLRIGRSSRAFLLLDSALPGLRRLRGVPASQGKLRRQKPRRSWP